MNARHIIKRIMRSIAITAVLALAALCLFACNLFGPNKPNNPPNDPCANGHEYSEEWNYDTTHHWHDSICAHKGEKGDYEQHIYPEGSDICEKCGYSRAVSYLSYLSFTKSRYGEWYSVKGSRSETDTIVIPSEYNGLPVTSIDNFGFQNFVNLKKIVIPDSVESIGIHTFSGCSALEDVTLPNGIHTIGSNAFFACSSLVDIEIPETVTTIDDYAFASCDSLLSFTVSEKIKTIGKSAFRSCVRLVEVYNLSELDIQCGADTFGEIALHARVVHTTADAKSNVLTENGFLYYADDNGASLLRYSGENKEIALPETLGGKPYTINDRAFRNTDITSLKITGGVTEIGANAFDNCTALETVELDGVAKIGDYAFYHCDALEAVDLDGVREIGEYAFNSCKNLSSVKFSDSLETIGEYAFLFCSALTELNVPDSVTKISKGAFESCNNLEKLTVPFVGMERTTDGKYDQDRVFGIIFGYYVRESTSSGVLQYSVKITMFKTDYYLYNIPSSLKTVTVTGDCVVPSNAFMNCSMIKNLDLSECTVNSEALSKCYGIEKLSTPLTAHVGTLFGTEQSYGMTAITMGSSTYYIPNKLTSITICGDTVPYNALYCCDKITTIELSDTIKTIRSCAFYGCSALAEITIPSSVMFIDYEVFSGCSSLTEITIPSSVTYINGSLFYNCSELTTVNLPDTLTYIAVNAFYGCGKLTTVNIPTALETIGNNAFYGTAITSLKLPNGLLTIGSGAFMNCAGIAAVTVPDTVTSIGSSAFSGCKAIAEITVPFIGGKLYDGDDTYNNHPFGYIFGIGSYDGGKATKQSDYGRTSGSETTYYVPTALKKVTVKSGPVFGSAFMNCDGLTEINFPSDITEIGGKAFYNCAALKNLVIPSGVTEIGEYALYGLTSVKYNEYQNGLYLGSVENNYMVLCGVKDKTAATLTINSNTTVLCEEAIGGMTALTAVNGIPSGVKRLPEKAIYNCAALTGITIPDTVETVTSGAISSCNKLTDISLPYLGDSLKTDEDDYRYPLGYIFGVSKYSTGVTQQEYCSVNGNTTSNYYYIPKSLRSVTVRGGVVSHGAFMNCGFLTGVTLPSSITEIGDKAFYECTGLLSIDFPSAVVRVGDRAFYDCTSLETVNVNDSLEKIGGSAFYKCTSLTEIELPNTVDSLGNSAFDECTSLENFDMPTSVTALNSYVFYKCTSLETVTLGNISGRIGSNAFYGCSKLGGISIPSGVTEIGETAFSGCTSLVTLTFNGNSLNIICMGAFMNCRGIESVSFPSSVRTIAQEAFKGCKAIETLNLPSSLVTIGDNAFNGCAGIKTLTFGSNVKYIGVSAFNGCKLITTLTVPDSVTEIGSGAFRGFDALTTLTIPFVGRNKTTTTPYEQMFGYIFGYYTDEYANKVIGTWQIPYNNLYYYYYIPTTLKSVTVTGGYINDSAFRNCSDKSDTPYMVKLTSVTIGADVTGIGQGAFMDTDRLTTLTFEDATGWTYASSLDSETWTSVNVTASDFITKIKQANNDAALGNKYFKHMV